MPFTLTPLPFRKDTLEPLMSAETIEYHYEKHHRGYVKKLNELISHTEFQTMSLEEIVKSATGPILNNASQAWNHSFFWNCMRPKSSEGPSKEVIQEFEKSFGSLAEFQADFTAKGLGLFGSGWIWLARDKSGALSLEALGNAGNPLTSDKQPILALDVWEHAYYLDHRNDRSQFVKTWWDLVNWDFVGKRMAETTPPGKSTKHVSRSAVIPLIGFEISKAQLEP